MSNHRITRQASLSDTRGPFDRKVVNEMTTVLVNPLDETPRPAGEPAPRLETLAGKTIGLLDISKPGGSLFLDRVERLLKERYGVAQIVRTTKPTFAKPAPLEVIDGLISAGCDGVIEALAD
jgi:hypothetical protein